MSDKLDRLERQIQSEIEAVKEKEQDDSRPDPGIRSYGKVAAYQDVLGMIDSL